MSSTVVQLLRSGLYLCKRNLFNINFYQSRNVGLSTDQVSNISLNYSSDDEKKILDVINQSNNELMRYNISKSRIKKIESWKLKYGQFQTIEQILEIEGFENKNLQKFCQSILNGGDDSKLEKNFKRNHSNFCIPNIPDKNKSIYKTCVSLHIGVSSVTWTKLNLLSSKGNLSTVNENSSAIEIEEWKYFYIADRKLQLQDLVRKCLEIDSFIPNADCYVLENQQMIQTNQLPGNTEQIKTNIQKAQLFAMLSFGLMKRNLKIDHQLPYDNEDVDTIADSIDVDGDSNDLLISQDFKKPNLFYLRRFLASKLFNLFVGTERVSSERVVLDLMRYHYNIKDMLNEENNNTTPENRLNIIFPSEIRKIYDLSEGYQREFLGQSLLIGLTFINLCLLKNPNSLGIIEGNSKIK